MAHSTTKAVGFEQFADILEQSEVVRSNDFGSAIIHDVIHPSMGSMTMINMVCGQCAIVSAA